MNNISSYLEQKQKKTSKETEFDGTSENNVLLKTHFYYIKFFWIDATKCKGFNSSYSNSIHNFEIGIQEQFVELY